MPTEWKRIPEWKTANTVFEVKNNELTPLTITLENRDTYTYSAKIYRGYPGHLQGGDISFKSSNATIKWDWILTPRNSSSGSVTVGSLGEDWFDLKFRDMDQEPIVIEGSIDGKSSTNKTALFNIVARGSWTFNEHPGNIKGAQIPFDTFYYKSLVEFKGRNVQNQEAFAQLEDVKRKFLDSLDEFASKDKAAWETWKEAEKKEETTELFDRWVGQNNPSWSVAKNDLNTAFENLETAANQAFEYGLGASQKPDDVIKARDMCQRKVSRFPRNGFSLSKKRL